jgi:hypothetical protein
MIGAVGHAIEIKYFSEQDLENLNNERLVLQSGCGHKMTN